MAKACPQLEQRTVDVAEAMDMEMQAPGASLTACPFNDAFEHEIVVQPDRLMAR